MKLLARWFSLLGVTMAFPVFADANVDYLRDIKPLLAERCFTCHGALKQKGTLRLDTVANMLAGGSSGPAMIPGKSSKSLLIQRVKGRGSAKRMPPPEDGEALSDKQLSLLQTWIDQGAKGIADEKPETDPREHWAFRKPVRPVVPSHSTKNPIDVFLAQKRRELGLTTQTLADKRLLLRRVSIDLIGLPPTLQEQDAFFKDNSADAYEKVVDRLLASPQYGERWARHWMDIWRYCDWYGLGQEVRNSQKHIWHWRDWIVESMNHDKGYDQMLREMLAADEMYPNDLDRLRATGFLARHYFRFNRTTWLDETIEHTAKAFLGLTLNFAKCHDHKYDPWTQENYYEFRAFFEPYQIRTDQVAGEGNYEKDGIPRVFDCDLNAPTFLHVRGEERMARKDKLLSPSLPKILTWEKLTIEPINLPLEAHAPGLRPFILENLLSVAEKQIASAQANADKLKKSKNEAKELEAAEKTLAWALLQPELIRAQGAADRAKYQEPKGAENGELAHIAAKHELASNLAKAEENLAMAELNLSKAAEAKKAALEKNLETVRTALAKAQKDLAKTDDNYTSLRGAKKTPGSPVETAETLARPFPSTSTGRRTALACWLTNVRNPLTARVAVNHLWARHFGRPLVGTVFDFGRKGALPSHPELLDFLAVEFMDHGWSGKHLHRLMVTSEAYRLSSSNAGAAKNAEIDPENRFYWRMNPMRMEAQVVRDSLLRLGNDLDMTMGGPSIPVAETSNRRSLYFVHSNNDQQKFLAMFDDASIRECYRRSESIIPQQALTLSNSKLALTMAAKIHDQLQAKGKVDEEVYIRAAFEWVLASTPSEEEVKECRSALADWRRLLQGQPDLEKRARIDLVHALLNHNDFITVR